jgi:hypothetical protein
VTDYAVRIDFNDEWYEKFKEEADERAKKN